MLCLHLVVLKHFDILVPRIVIPVLIILIVKYAREFLRCLLVIV